MEPKIELNWQIDNPCEVQISKLNVVLKSQNSFGQWTSHLDRLSTWACVITVRKKCTLPRQMCILHLTFSKRAARHPAFYQTCTLSLLLSSLSILSISDMWTRNSDFLFYLNVNGRRSVLSLSPSSEFKRVHFFLVYKFRVSRSWVTNGEYGQRTWWKDQSTHLIKSRVSGCMFLKYRV